MRKLFFTLCFICVFTYSSDSISAIRSIVGDSSNQHNTKPLPPRGKRPDAPKFKTKKEMFVYIEERIEKTVSTEINPDEDLQNPSSTSVLPSNEHLEAEKEKGKSFFEKVYESAIERVRKPNNQNTQDTIKKDTKIDTTNKQEKQWKATPNYQTVDVTLPSGNKILAPAIEHIPYLIADIDILPNGIMKIKENIIVVANGEKLKNGLSKSLPKFSISRSGEKTNLTVNLVSVKINGKEFAYKIEELGKHLIISPKDKYILEPGVYNYEFEYIVDRQLTQYDGFRELYWNITGNNWNLTVARVGAILRIPGTEKDLGHSAFINGRRLDLNSFRTIRMGSNVLGFTSTRPTFIGESSGFIISIPDKDFFAVDLDKKIYWAIDDYGNIVLSILGFLAIAGAYFVSWIFISDKKSSSKYSIQKNGPIFRYLTKGIFDKISFGSFILDLYKKGIIDIKENALIKLTDNVSSLNKNERKAINNLFTNKESTLDFSKANILKFNRAYNIIEQDTKSRIKSFLLKINAGYIIFSIAMLILTQMGISMLGYSTKYNMLVMAFADIAIATAIWLVLKKFQNKIFGILTKIVATIILFISWLVLTSVVGIYSALFIILTIYAIFAYTGIFSKRNGLIKNNVNDARATREQIIKNVDSICFPKNFISQQANIFALDLADFFEERMQDKEFYKLGITKNLLNIL